MLAMLMLGTAALASADVDAAANRLRANGPLLESLFAHADPLVRCTSKAMGANDPNAPPVSAKPDDQYQYFMKKLNATAQTCGFDQELIFWISKIKTAFPDLSSDTAKATAQNSLSFEVFDSTINQTH